MDSVGEVSPSLQTRCVFRYPLSGKILFDSQPGPYLPILENIKNDSVKVRFFCPVFGRNSDDSSVKCCGPTLNWVEEERWWEKVGGFFPITKSYKMQARKCLVGIPLDDLIYGGAACFCRGWIYYCVRRATRLLSLWKEVRGFV